MFISKILARYIINHDKKDSLGVKFRSKRISPLLGMIKDVYAQKEHVRIIDVGGTDVYWKIIPASFLEQHNVEITIINLQSQANPGYDGSFIYKQADGCDLKDFPDDSFDIVHSNSVIEHVGDWGRMMEFANEIHRVARKHFIQTPNYWFPIEPHCMTLFYHWLPRPIRVWLVMSFSLGHWSKRKNIEDAIKQVNSAQLLNYKMFAYLFPRSKIIRERFLFLTKSFVAIRK